MTGAIIDGKALAKEKRNQMRATVEELKSKGITPGLAVLLVGDNPASASYVKGKVKDCKEIGIHSELKTYKTDITEKELLAEIEKCNQDPVIHGLLVQLPLPDHISEKKVIDAVAPEKDVDGFHPVSVGKMVIGEDTFYSCTPAGIIEMVKAENIEIAGKHVVIVGRSNIVGKPAGLLFLQENATVTYCHSKTPDLQAHTKQADILVAAAGRLGLIGAEDVKDGAVVIDVAMNRNEEGKLKGDVKFDEVKEVASKITPVPGGVGPMTRAMLLHNTIKAARRTLAAQKG